MKRIAASLITVIITNAVVSPSRAAVPDTTILYVKALPVSVIKRMPPGARSRFFGSFQISPNGERKFVHLFDPDSSQKPEQNSNRYKLLLHVLNGQGQILNSVSVSYPSTGAFQPHNLFEAQLLWLDPETKQKPILKFDCFGYGETGEPLGEHILVTFGKEFKGKVSVQGMSFGHYTGSTVLGKSSSFNHRDNKGLLEIHHSFFLNYEVQDNGSTEAKWILRWDGRQFSPVNDPFHGKSEPFDKPIW